MSENWQTRKSLLLRASDPDDHRSFEEFVEYYQDFIHIILKKFGVRDEDCKDLKQNILLKLWKDLKKFNPDHIKSSFRGWLSVVLKHQIYRFFSNNKRKYETPIEELSIENSQSNELEEMIESEWRAYITTLAMVNLEKVFDGKAIEVFNLTLDGMSTKEISETLKIQESSIYTLRTRVKGKFQREIRQLRDLLEFPA